MAQKNVLNPESQKKTVASLQAVLTDLLHLAMQFKQAHWNVRGKQFRSVHLQLDEIIDDARLAADEVAERIVTLNEASDGRPSTIAETSTLEVFPAGFVRTDQVTQLAADRLLSTIQAIRKGIDTVGDLDPISEDLLIGISAKLEKHLWMVQSQNE